MAFTLLIQIIETTKITAVGPKLRDFWCNTAKLKAKIPKNKFLAWPTPYKGETLNS